MTIPMKPEVPRLLELFSPDLVAPRSLPEVLFSNLLDWFKVESLPLLSLSYFRNQEGNLYWLYPMKDSSLEPHTRFSMSYWDCNIRAELEVGR